MTWQDRHNLLQELLLAPRQSFVEREDGREFFFHPTAADRRKISVFSEDKTPEKAVLCVKGQAIGGAEKLYRWLSGQLSFWQMCRLMSRLKKLTVDDWESIPQESGNLMYKTTLGPDMVELKDVSDPNTSYLGAELFLEGKKMAGNWLELHTYVHGLYEKMKCEILTSTMETHRQLNAK